jgi:hypothetical protein
MRIYPCDDSREWWDWEARYVDECQLDRYEIIWRDHERRRMERDNEACGYVPQTPDSSGAGEIQQGRRDGVEKQRPSD